MEGDTMINRTVTIIETDALCIWGDLFDDEEKNLLIDGLIITGLASAVFILWLIYKKPKLMLGKMHNKQSYNNLFIFITAVLLRTIFVLFSRLDYFKQIAEKLIVTCDMIGFLETFLAVFEVEALTHVCIERYVVAKYITKGWKIKKNHYVKFLFLCHLFATLYSAPAVYGLGRYAYDFGCLSCTYDMMLPDTWHRYLISTVFFLRSFKSAAFMVVTLFWARKLERNFDAGMKRQADLNFTKCVVTMTIVNLTCWAPIALIRTCVVLSQVLYDEIYIPSSFALRWAMWIHEVTPVLTTLTIFYYNRCAHKRVVIANEHDSEHTLKDD